MDTPRSFDIQQSCQHAFIHRLSTLVLIIIVAIARYIVSHFSQFVDASWKLKKFFPIISFGSTSLRRLPEQREPGRESIYNHSISLSRVENLILLNLRDG